MPEFGQQGRDRNDGPRRRSDQRDSGGPRAGGRGKPPPRQGGFRGRDDRSGKRDDRSRDPRQQRDRPNDDAKRAKPKDPTPALPDGAEHSALDPEIRRDLGSLPKQLAEQVGAHLVAAGMLLEEDPEKALEHARFARRKAARVAVVREASGLAAYHAGEWSEALAELRAVRRMSGHSGHVAIMADCERALGRPERALELAAETRGQQMPKAEEIELRIVAAGARRDIGQLDAAVVGLQGPDLDAKLHEPWSARLFYAYADNLAAAGRTEEAVRWFVNAAQADIDEDTDAAERAIELSSYGEDTVDLATLVNNQPADEEPAEDEKRTEP